MQTNDRPDPSLQNMFFVNKGVLRGKGMKCGGVGQAQALTEPGSSPPQSSTPTTRGEQKQQGAHQMKCAVDRVSSPVALDPGLTLDLPQ